MTSLLQHLNVYIGLSYFTIGVECLRKSLYFNKKTIRGKNYKLLFALFIVRIMSALQRRINGFTSRNATVKFPKFFSVALRGKFSATAVSAKVNNLIFDRAKFGNRINSIVNSDNITICKSVRDVQERDRSAAENFSRDKRGDYRFKRCFSAKSILRPQRAPTLLQTLPFFATQSCCARLVVMVSNVKQLFSYVELTRFSEIKMLSVYHSINDQMEDFCFVLSTDAYYHDSLELLSVVLLCIPDVEWI